MAEEPVVHLAVESKDSCQGKQYLCPLTSSSLPQMQDIDCLYVNFLNTNMMLGKKLTSLTNN